MKTKQTVSVVRLLIVAVTTLGIGCAGIALLVVCTSTRIVDVVLPVRAKIADIEKAIEIYAMRHDNKLPASLNSLVESSDKGNPPLLKKEDLIDPWGEPIRYEREGRKFIICSSGPDKKLGTADDNYTGRGSSELYESWKARLAQAAESQATNAVQEATPETAKPPAGIKKKATAENRQTPDEPAESKSIPWKIPLLIGILLIIGIIVTAWHRLTKK